MGSLDHHLRKIEIVIFMIDRDSDLIELRSLFREGNQNGISLVSNLVQIDCNHYFWRSIPTPQKD